jgi:hypothetical protein
MYDVKQEQYTAVIREMIRHENNVTNHLIMWLLAGLLAAGVASTALAAETSGCVTCHLDKEMLVKSLTVIKAKKSAMQSGQG